MEKIIEIKELAFHYGEHTLFENISFEIDEGSFCTIMGASGIGKSTLARLLVGLEPMQGYVKIDQLFLNPQNIDAIRRQVGVVFENTADIFITETAREELSFSLEVIGDSSISSKVNGIAKKLGITHILDRNPRYLSAGEKQLVALACSLIYEPKILIMDDALVMVDGITREKIFEVLKKFNKKGLTILNFTGNSEDILYGNELIIMTKNGVIHKPVKALLEEEKVFTHNQINLPFISELSTKLKYYQVINKTYTDKEKLIGALWK